LFIIAWKPGALPHDWIGRARFVPDGDTIYVDDGGVQRAVRIFGIDAPEVGQSRFAESRDALRALLKGHQLHVYPRNFDKYGRIVADVVIQPNESVAEWMLQHGWAWWEYRFAGDVDAFRDLQNLARGAGRGIWARKPYGFAPWIWRYRHHIGY
jgi:endonuclease YncB( thermonuclease family)